MSDIFISLEDGTTREATEAEIVEIQARDAAELVASTESKKTNIRMMRNQRLLDCDWTQISDCTVDKQAWATYRQALRDITNQAGFPDAVQWPTQPE